MGRMSIAASVSAVCLLFADNAQAGFDLDQVMRNAADQYIRPAYKSFAETSNLLADAQKQLCAKPSIEALQTAKTAFAQTVASWSNAEIFRAGPVLQENRLERVLFYPDRKGTGLKQVQSTLADGDPSATDATTLAGKSVAMQGLGALEFILSGTGSEMLATPEGSFRCSYGLAVAENMRAISGALMDAWSPDGQVDRDWNSHGQNNPFARNDREALNLVLGTIIHGLELVQDNRIGAFLDPKEGKDKPNSAIYWRSGLTIRSIEQNLKSVQSILDASGLDGALAADQAYVVDNIRFDFKSAIEALQSLDVPVAKLLGDPKQREKLMFVRNTVGDLIHRFDQDFAVASGLAAGFSFSDGD